MNEEAEDLRYKWGITPSGRGRWKPVANQARLAPGQNHHRLDKYPGVTVEHLPPPRIVYVARPMGIRQYLRWWWNNRKGA